MNRLSRQDWRHPAYDPPALLPSAWIEPCMFGCGGDQDEHCIDARCPGWQAVGCHGQHPISGVDESY